MPLVNIQRSPQQNPSVPIMQECVDAIVDHQKLLALMKGELVKGLLPQSSIRADYTAQRIKGWRRSYMISLSRFPLFPLIHLSKFCKIDGRLHFLN